MNPADCDHPEEQLLPLPYQGRPPRADEWECGQCGHWNVAKEPDYKRRKVAEFEDFYQNKFPPVPPPPIDWLSTPPAAPAIPKLRGTGYLDGSEVVIDKVKKLIALGMVRTVDVSMTPEQSDGWLGAFSDLLRMEPPGLKLLATGVDPQHAVDVMVVLFELVKNRGTKIIWNMHPEMLFVLQKRANPPNPVYPAPDTSSRPTLFGGEIRIDKRCDRGEIILNVR